MGDATLSRPIRRFFVVIRLVSEAVRQLYLISGTFSRLHGRDAKLSRLYREFRLTTFSKEGKMPPTRVLVDFLDWTAEARKLFH